MILPDVNVLIYAYRPDSQFHAQCRKWLESVLTGHAAYGISPQVLSAVARITTNPRVFSKPDSLQSVLAFSNVLLDQPHCQVVLPGPRHWRIFCDLARQARVTGALIQDAWFAALAVESGCEWITLDRDYQRFPGLRWRVPD